MAFTNHMDHPTATIILKDAFNLPLAENLVLEGMAAGHPLSPTVDPDYVFSAERFRELLTFWVMRLKALKLVGDPGTGKTSVIEQWHARLGLPLFVVPCHEAMTDIEMFGQYLPTADGTLKWVDSPVMRTHRYGGSVVFDEWNTLNPNTASLLNQILEGYTITIPQTGEVVAQHPNARFFCTQNPVNGRTAVQGRYSMDSASDDRFMELLVDYLPAQDEITIVERALRKLDVSTGDDVIRAMASKFVEIAGEVRKAYRHNDEPANYAFTKPMSTRVLKRWATLFIAFKGVQGESAITYSLKRAFSGLDSEMREAVLELTKSKFGI